MVLQKTKLASTTAAYRSVFVKMLGKIVSFLKCHSCFHTQNQAQNNFFIENASSTTKFQPSTKCLALSQRTNTELLERGAFAHFHNKLFVRFAAKVLCFDAFI